MIRLNFQTYNSRWGERGINFLNYEDYVKTLGFLSNPNHYDNDKIEIKIENNQIDNAWDNEKRIYYYGNDQYLTNFPALYEAKSAGVGNVTYRINSNGYIDHLIQEYGFIDNNIGRYINRVVPSDLSYIENCLKENLKQQNLNIQYFMEIFYSGYDL